MTRRLALWMLAVAVAGCAHVDAPSPAPVVELRGVWLTNVDSDVMLSRGGIAEAMQFLADHHINVVYPVVLNNGATTYPSATMEAVTGVRIDPRYAGRDPLAEIVEEAARHDIAVIPWFEFGFAASHNADGGPVLAARPEWAARDRDGGLLTKNGFEWMNAFHPEVQRFVLDLVLEVARAYDVAGVQGDDRLPANPSEGGYSDVTRALYRAEHGGAEPPADALDPAWLQWRADRLTAFARRLHDEVKALDPTLQVSWSPSVYPWSVENYLQDWPAWAGVADQILPQVYRYDVEAYRATLATQWAEAVRVDAHGRLYPGVLMNVGDYVIPAADLLEVMRVNRAQGVGGEVFFFYEGLRKNGDALADTLRATFYARPARRPF
ncbi:glycoside hydrolase family 10 protein [Rubrivirga sp.]|uniref:glycoside hydrolase family 10 protein n=1 Tax=Rubrivirga sp. TaxID=1885344 RepID=UPI003B51DFC5